VPPESATVAGWELALRLRERRMELGIEVKTITDRLGFTRNYWSAVENERKILSAEKLAQLLDLMEFDKDEQGELLGLREAARRRGWWVGYSALFRDELLRYIGLEHGAQNIRTYESLLIPGLLQTPDYARALMEADVSVRPAEIEKLIAARLRRQQRLTGDDPLRLVAVISQAALLQQIGGIDVLRDQLRHVAETVEAHPDTIELRVIPFEAPGCGIFGASTFHLIGFASGRLPMLAWQESVTSLSILSDEMQVRELEFTHKMAMQLSLSTEESLRLVRRYAEG
jgi:transcriptional regulator with XRE-family HTH domain